MLNTEKLFHTRWVSSIRERQRRGRLDYILNRVDTFSHMRILDVGCGNSGRSVHQWIDPSYELLGIDLYVPDEVEIDHPNFSYRQQDARDLSCFGDDEFDLCISVGMMEHIGHLPDLQQMAREIDRVAKQYVIVVPWRYAPIEPHFKWPIFQLMPDEIQRWLVTSFDLHDLREKVQADPLYIRNHYLWLTKQQWGAIWPHSKISVFNLENYVIVKSNRA
jgi:SAM-dependent methyltransferase